MKFTVFAREMTDVEPAAFTRPPPVIPETLWQPVLHSVAKFARAGCDTASRSAPTVAASTATDLARHPSTRWAFLLNQSIRPIQFIGPPRGSFFSGACGRMPGAADANLSPVRQRRMVLRLANRVSTGFHPG
jgi:hypothetical protein